VTRNPGDFRKFLTGLLLIVLLAFFAGYLLVSLTALSLSLSEITLLSVSFFLITFISLIIFGRGQKKEAGSQTMHILAAISVKMLLEMVLALIWFFVLKKTSPSDLLLFFVLYLAFSLYSIIFMLKTLKSKSI
jgi:F0F1-type ATP synthase assembly protein I